MAALPEMILLDSVPPGLYQELNGLEGLTIFHSQAWHVFLQRVFSWRIRAVIWRDHAGRLMFFLPFVTKRRMGRKLHICLPLGYAIGPAYHPLIEWESIDLRPLIWPLEIHASVPLKGMVSAAHHHVTALDLSGVSDAAALLKRFHAAKRRKITAAEREGVHTYLANTPDAYAQFSELQAATRKRQGAPGYPANFFQIMAEELAPAGMSRLYLAEHQERILGGVIFLHYHNTALYAYGASVTDRDALRFGINQAVMWAAIRGAWQDGCSMVDFGSTPMGQDELLRYKEQFGGVSQPLVHSYGSASGQPLDTPQDSVLARIGGAVLRHTPLPVFKRLSPWLLRAVI